MIGIISHSPEKTLIGEAIPRGCEKIQTCKCLNCGEQSYFKRNYKENCTESKREPMPSGTCKWYGKGQQWTNECKTTTDRSKNALGDLFQAPIPNSKQQQTSHPQNN